MAVAFWSALVFCAATSGCTADSGLVDCDPGYRDCVCSGGVCVDGLICSDNVCIPSILDPTPNSSAMNDGPNPDAFFADDPPPMVCLPDGTMGPPPELPGGTPECPDDKNREGCPCTNLGQQAACWPGLRIHRERGICQDGVTTCNPVREFGKWGPCEGYVLPVEGATNGPESCGCFSSGRWEIDNLVPCLYDDGPEGVWLVSTFLDGLGQPQCPTSDARPPVPEPGTNFSTNRLTVDCEGTFNLCLTLRGGVISSASSNDCVVTQICTGDVWVESRGQVQELPELPSWVSTDSVCARRFLDEGGYGEFSVLGQSIECDAVDDGAGGPFVFLRFPFCPAICATEPSTPGCEECTTGGGAGNF